MHYPRFRQRAAIASLLLLLALSPAATQTLPLSSTATPSEVEKFCTGIADAARDRRYALQAAELKKLQADIDERIKRLEEKRADYESWMKRREDFLKQAEDGVVKIYASMKPDEAASKLAEVGPELAAGILMKLESRKAAVILNEMNAKTAATLTAVMAAAGRREDPS